MLTEAVHRCVYASQPMIQIGCTGSSTRAWGDGDSGIEGVYRADNGDLYTFADERVTCPDCKLQIAQQTIDQLRAKLAKANRIVIAARKLEDALSESDCRFCGSAGRHDDGCPRRDLHDALGRRRR